MLSLVSFILSLINIDLFPSLILVKGSSDGDSGDDSESSEVSESDSEISDSENEDNQYPIRDAQNRRTVPQEDFNAPEQIMDDLDSVDNARRGDLNALEDIKRNYPEFFEGKTDKKGLKGVERYLEGEFDPELARSEREADEMDIQEELAREEELARINNNENVVSEDNNYKRPNDHDVDYYEEKPVNVKRRKLNSDDDDNNSGGNASGSSGIGPSGPSGPSGSSVDSNNYSSKIAIFILSSLETISEVFNAFLF